MDKKFKFKFDKDKIKLQLKDLGKKFIKKKNNFRSGIIVLLFFVLLGFGYAIYSDQNGQEEIIDLNTSQYNYDSPDSLLEYEDEEVSFYSNSERENGFSLNYPRIEENPSISIQNENDPVMEREEVEGVITEPLRAVTQIQRDELGIELLKPCSGEIIRAPGWYYHTVLDDWRYQQGIEFTGNTGDIVMATAHGQVSSVKEDEYRGIMVILEHENGWITEYGHLERVSISPGNHVSKGQEIGRVGVTGMTSQPSLYFSLKNTDGAVDPVEFFE